MDWKLVLWIVMALILSATSKLNQLRGPPVILDRVRNGKWGTGNRYCCLQSARVLFFLQFCVARNSKMWCGVLFSVQLHVAEDGDAALWNVLQEDYDAITELNLTCTPCVTWESVLCGKLDGGVRWVSIAPDLLEPINFLQCHSYISKTRRSRNAAEAKAVACHHFSLLFPFPLEHPQLRVSPM